MTLLELRDVAVNLNQCQVVRPLNLELQAGEVLGLIGPNGAGKSTLLKAVAGLLAATGTMAWKQQALTELSLRQRARAIGYLAQSANAHWPLKVERLITLGRLPHLNWWQRPSPEDRELVEQAIALAEVAHLRKRTIDQLSGGERARVMLARLFATQPEVILADEPVSALDPYHQLHIMELLQLHAKTRGGVIVVLHDLTLAARFCDRIALLSQGSLLACDTPEQVLNSQHLAQVYGIAAKQWHHDGELTVVPWQRLCQHEPSSALPGRSL